MPRDWRYSLYGEPGSTRNKLYRGSGNAPPFKPKRLAQRQNDFESMSPLLEDGKTTTYYDKSGNTWHRPGSQNPRK